MNKKLWDAKVLSEVSHYTEDEQHNKLLKLAERIYKEE